MGKWINILSKVQMKITLIGYGKMGQEIEKIALKRNHSITSIITHNNTIDLEKIDPKNTDVVIEFTEPLSAPSHIKYCIDKKIPIICGTTGWNKKEKEIQTYCLEKKGSLFYSSNFSIGIHLFLFINEKAAQLMKDHPEYDVRIQEKHHIHKKDKPSGTSITLAERLLSYLTSKKKWSTTITDNTDTLFINSIREQEIVGIHTTEYTSNVDSITLEHTAHRREGFALGAVKAAEWIKGKTGIFGMNDLLNL